MPTRPAVLAGHWYPASPAELTAEVERCRREAEAAYPACAADIPPGRPVAGIAPHAGLAYSGVIAAAVYRLLPANPGPDTFVIFGPSHRTRLAAPAVWPAGAWATPLGDIAVDDEFAALLVESGEVSADVQAHEADNAIELQTPFIRHMFPDAKIVPVAVPNSPAAGRLGRLAARCADTLARRAVAVASTDLTHYGSSFGVTPAGTGRAALDWTRANDRRFLAALENMDTDEALRLAAREHSACGGGAAAAAVEWARESGCAAGRVVGHTNSHDVAGGPDEEAWHFVGYAGVIFAAER